MDKVKKNLFDMEESKGENLDFSFTDIETLSVDELIKLAEEHYEKMDYEKAYIFYDEAIKKDPKNEASLTSYGFFLSNVKDSQKAIEVLSEAIMLNPNNNPKKYLYMGQLYEGENSATFYLKAIDILSQRLEAFQNGQMENKEDFDIADAKKDLSEAYSAMGELYLTDLVKAQNSVTLCHDYLMKALEVNEFNLDAYLQLANYFLEVDKYEVATETMVRALQIYKDRKALDDQEFLEEYEMETYFGLGKIFIELGDFANAVIFLEDIYEENSENFEVIYCAAYANFMLKNYVTCQEMLDDFNSKKVPCGDEEILTAKKELENELAGVDFTKGNDYEEEEESKEEHIKGEMELE